MFQFPITLNKGSVSAPFVAPVVTTLNLLSPSTIAAAILQKDDGLRLAGLYLYEGRNWHYCLPSLEVSKSVINGYALAIYFGLTTAVTAPTGSVVFRNAVQQTGLVMNPGNGFYCTQGVGGSGPGAGVTSLNGLAGTVTLSGLDGIDVTSTGTNIDIKPGSLDEGTF